MGKMRRARQRFKDFSAKEKTNSGDGAQKTDHTESINSSLFSGINIDTATLETKLPHDFDKCSVISKKSSLTGNINKLKKKEKRKLRRQAFLSSIANIHQKRKDFKTSPKSTRAKEDAKSTLKRMMTTASNLMNQKPKKPRTRKKLVQQQKETQEDLETFSKVLKNQSFQTDPESTILQHLRVLAELEK